MQAAAVFVDFENLFFSLKNREEFGGQRTRDLCLAILEHLKGRLQAENCSLVLGRSYAAFDAYPGMEMAHDLALMGLDPQYVLVGHHGKNAADVQLAVDVSRVLFRRPDIHAIVIVSGDRDFIPIARQVLEENRELRVVAIPDSTSGDLRMRVGAERFWNALDLLPAELRAPRPDRRESTAAGPEPAPPVPEVSPVPEAASNGAAAGPTPPRPAFEPRADAMRPVARPRAAIVGHIPVTWKTAEEGGNDDAVEHRLAEVLDLIVKAQARHASREIWLSPFLKGPMSQHFSGLVHPDRRALINELRNRGILRVEERENMFADHPYSVIVLDEAHPAVQSAHERGKRS
ncbi:MAG: NYN domain-containing protein [Planctomycetes bacterium]|nr:NYN domain-containing protein [Planctomycetota bacterium]